MFTREDFAPTQNRQRRLNLGQILNQVEPGFSMYLAVCVCVDGVWLLRELFFSHNKVKYSQTPGSSWFTADYYPVNVIS